MDFVVLDLEWNGAYSRRIKHFLNEIIEIGAVRVDGSLKVLDTFEALVRPQVGKKISGKVKTLTSITNEELENGLVFMQAVSRFGKWAKDAAVVTWGTSDILALIENYSYYGGGDRVPFLSRYADIQAYCEHEARSGGPGRQMGLSAAADLLGVDESGFDHHRALGDSLLALRCFQKVYDPGRFAPFLQDAKDDEFYRRMEFKNMAICDLSNPLIHPQDLAFRCDACGHSARRIGEWQLHNKSFFALFHCSRCDKKFYGRVQFKLKYEGLAVKKRILPYREKESEEAKDESSAEEGAREIE